MREFWASVRRACRSRYVIYLESELERLRLDNSRLYDALLVKHGQPPLTPRESKPQIVRSGRPLPSQAARRMSYDSLHREDGKTQ